MLNIDCHVTAVFVTALLEYLDHFNAVQDERQSVTKGLLVKWVLVD